MDLAAKKVERSGWQFSLAGEFDRGLLAVLVARTLEAVGGVLGEPLRRSRHATTYVAKVATGRNGSAEVYVKVFDAPRGLEALKEQFRGSRALHVTRISAELIEAGFRPARLLMMGQNPKQRRSLIVTARAGGYPLLEALAVPARGSELARKRGLLRGLGIEIARLHRAGFVHGDLTPYNIFVMGGEPPRFVLIDHDRTRHAFRLGRQRRQLRNLVQLGRFEVAGLSRTDRMRVFAGYAQGLKLRDPRPLMRRVLAMLAARQAAIAADHAARALGGR